MKKTKHIWHRMITLLSLTVMMILVLGISVSAAGTKKVSMKKIAANQYQYIGNLTDSTTTVYHKIKFNKAGCIGVSGSSINASTGQYGSMSIVLCDKNLKPLEAKKGTAVSASKTAIYGINKGTYYIKVSKQKKYVLGLSYASVPNNGGSSKSKAWQLPKQKKIYPGILAAGESSGKADWFRFKVTKTKKLQLSIENAVNGTVNFYVYGPGLSSKGALIRMSANSEGVYTIVNKYGTPIKAKKGTYYIKVVRNSNSKKASGIYSIKWALTS